MEYLSRSDRFESLLGRANDALGAEFDRWPSLGKAHPSLQIVGLPRSGTTIVYQLLARSGLVGYPSNVMAYFWRAPPFGAMLQARLAQSEPTLSLASLAGRTEEPLDPHEFGYFWRAALGHSSNSVEVTGKGWGWKRLQEALDQVTAEFEKPVIYKNYLALARGRDLLAKLANQAYLIVDRKIEDVAASLLAIRRKIGIRPEADFGLAPAGGSAQQTLSQRIARQILALDALSMSSPLRADAGGMVISYEDFCANPRQYIAAILAHIGVSARKDEIERSIPSELARRPHDLADDPEFRQIMELINA